MKQLILLVTFAAAMGGCKKKKAEEGTAPPPPPPMTDPGSGSAGSGMAQGSGSGGSAAEPVKPKTPEELAKRYEECGNYLNDKKLDQFADCLAPDIVSEAPGGMPTRNGRDAVIATFKNEEAGFPDMKGEPVLTLVSGHTVIGVRLITGTNSGPMKTPMGEMPKTDKKVGFMIGHILEIDDAGRAKHSWDFMDFATMHGQLSPDPKHPVRAVTDKAPMHEVALAKDDDKEKANLAAFNKLIDAFNKHDAKAFSDLVADDVVWSEQPQPKDENKKELMANLPEMWKGFSDLKFTVTSSWAAGDYVAAVESFDGTNDGDISMMKLKKTGKKLSLPFLAIHKLDGGKVKATWIFFQGMQFAQQLGLMPPPGAAPPPAPPTKK